MMENKETITFAEFQAWLTGLIRGKGGALPDKEDWRQIRRMLEKVEAEKVIVKEIEYVPSIPAPTPEPWPTNPWPSPWQDPHPYVPPRTVPWMHYTWTSDGTGSPPPMFDQITSKVDDNSQPWDNQKFDLTFAIDEMLGKKN